MTLVHEVYLRLSNPSGVVESRSHFFHLAAQVMRCVLVDGASARMANKRGGNVTMVGDDAEPIAVAIPDHALIALDDALRTLEKRDPQKCRLVELRFFAGMRVEETAEVLGISVCTAAREWLVAKVILYSDIRRIDSSSYVKASGF